MDSCRTTYARVERSQDPSECFFLHKIHRTFFILEVRFTLPFRQSLPAFRTPSQVAPLAYKLTPDSFSKVYVTHFLPFSSVCFLHTAYSAEHAPYSPSDARRRTSRWVRER